MDVISLNCPNCGASVSTQTKQCEYCSSDILVKSFRSISSMPLPQVNKYVRSYQETEKINPGSSDILCSIAMCFLRLKKYDQALESFEKAQANSFDDATPYFYAAVAQLKGRKPFLCQRTEIDKMEENLNAALSIAEEPIYHYFLSYIGRDFFKRKFLNHTPSHEEHLQNALNAGLTDADIDEFHEMTGTQRA